MNATNWQPYAARIALDFLRSKNYESADRGRIEERRRWTLKKRQSLRWLLFVSTRIAWSGVVSSGPRQHASQTLIKRVAGTRGPTHLSAVCLFPSPLRSFSLPPHLLSSWFLHGTKNRNDSLKFAREGGQKFHPFKIGARDLYLSIFDSKKISTVFPRTEAFIRFQFLSTIRISLSSGCFL